MASLMLIIAKFESKIQNDGPANPVERKAWQEIRRMKGSITWAQAVGQVDTAVFLILDPPSVVDRISLETPPLKDILPYLKEPPRIITLLSRLGDFFGHEFFLDSAFDLYLLDVLIDPDAKTEQPTSIFNPLEHLNDPLAHIRLAGYQCRDRHNKHPYWPSRCGDFKELRLWSVDPPAREGNTIHEESQAISVQWRDFDGGRRFKDHRQRCTGIEFVDPRDVSNRLWEEDFLNPLQALKAAGIVKNVEHWELVMQDLTSERKKREDDKCLERRCRKYDREEKIRRYKEAIRSKLKEQMCFETT